MTKYGKNFSVSIILALLFNSFLILLCTCFYFFAEGFFRQKVSGKLIADYANKKIKGSAGFRMKEVKN